MTLKEMKPNEKSLVAVEQAYNSTRASYGSLPRLSARPEASYAIPDHATHRPTVGNRYSASTYRKSQLETHVLVRPKDLSS